MKKFNLVVCGGTFDHLHKGHIEFLRFVMLQAEEVLIGLTTELYFKNYGDKKKKDTIEPYAIRERKLKEFVLREEVKKFKIVPIDNIAGPAVYDASYKLQAIVVTEETIKGAKFINEERIKNGLPPLEIIIFPMVKNYNNQIISSSKIRLGEINRTGNPYINPLWTTTKLSITPSLRNTLAQPFGKLLKTEDIDFSNLDPLKIITVGDVVTYLFNEKKVNQKISVVDYHVQRKKTFGTLEDLNFDGKEYVIEAKNPPGLLTPSLWEAVSKTFSPVDSIDRVVIKIDGEEDLSALPLILAAPLGFTLFYGQPGQGIVQITVSEEKKEEAYLLVKGFKKITF